DKAGVDDDPAPWHAPGVDLLRGNDVDLPVPFRRVLAEHRRLGDEPVGDRADPLALAGIAIDVAALLLEDVPVGDGGALVHLLRGHQEELLALHADGALLGGRRAPGERHSHREHDGGADHPTSHVNLPLSTHRRRHYHGIAASCHPGSKSRRWNPGVVSELRDIWTWI